MTVRATDADIIATMCVCRAPLFLPSLAALLVVTAVLTFLGRVRVTTVLLGKCRLAHHLPNLVGVSAVL